MRLIIVFFAFSLLSSAVYLINDLRDLEDDQKHPKKKHRLIASGKLSKNNALIAIGALLCISFSVLLSTNNLSFLMGAIYLITNLSYSFYFKQIPVIDISMLAFGYIIRLIIGGEIASVPISNWLFSLVVSIAIYIILFKRLSDVTLKQASNRTRFYAAIRLPQILHILLGFILITYIGYIVVIYQNSPAFLYAILTIPFAIFAAIRFHIGMFKRPHQDPIKIMISDAIFLGVCLCWVVLFGITLY